MDLNLLLIRFIKKCHHGNHEIYFVQYSIIKYRAYINASASEYTLHSIQPLSDLTIIEHSIFLLYRILSCNKHELHYHLMLPQ